MLPIRPKPARNSQTLARNLHARRKQQQGGAVWWTLLWLIVWVLGLLGICYLCLRFHWPAAEAKLKTSVQTSLAAVPSGAADFDMNLVDGRTVELTGSVDNEQQLQALVNAAENTDGVRQVDNQLQIAQPQTRDKSPASLHVVKTDSQIILTGQLANKQSADLVRELLTETYPDAAIADQLLVDENTEQAGWLEPAAKTLTMLPELDKPELHIDGSEIEILGSAIRPESEALLTSAINENFGDSLTLSNQIVTPASFTESPTVPEPTAEPEAEIAAEPEADSTAEPEADSTAEPEADSTAEPEADSTAEPEADSPAEPEADSTAEPEADSTAEPEADSTAEPEADSTAEPEADSTAEPEADSTAEPETDSTAEPEAETVAESEPETPTTLDSEAENEEPAETTSEPVISLAQRMQAINTRGILFDSSSDILKPESRVILDSIAAIFVDYPDSEIIIAGYTDSSGSDNDNQLLSEARARSVRDYLVSRGVAVDSLSAYGYGERAPIADNSTPAGRARNRRIEFIY